ncbi:hypothetical protein [Bacteroides sp.]|uniref:hypothetical protein n=1 Tax=Bacteroides sp. TaxID=29523 RepID=UPI0026127880|nr:hypothetical protein [Bacteroides sp.]MDD3039473.1 hypothetical protein [Bacteroides sp.]
MPEEIQEKQNLTINPQPQICNTDIINRKMSDKELSIYDGLKYFRPEIAVYYKDGLLIKDSAIQSKSNLLAHLLREIDGGLRAIFEDPVKKKTLKTAITKEYIESLFEEYKSDYENFIYLNKVTPQDIKDYSGHISSIAASFELSMDSQLIKEYIKVAVWFNRYAHRSDENTQAPRDPHDILLIWRKFENVLLQLLTHYHIYDRVDSLLSHQTPTELIIKQLPNLFREEHLKKYFWNKLLRTSWLEPLYNKGYFSGANNPTPVFDETTNEYKVPNWVELGYIQNAAWQLSQNQDADFSIILKIIDNICLYKNANRKRITNHNTDSAIIFLISILPTQEIKQKHFKYLTAIIKSENGSQYSDDFQKRFIDKFIAVNDKKNLLRCLSVILLHKKGRGRFESYRSLLDRYFVYEFIDKKNEDVIRICGLDGFKVVEKTLKKVEKEHWYSINAIEDHYQNGQNLDNFSHQVVRFIREYLLKLPCDEGLIQIISDYLHKDRLTIYPRIAYYIINSRYKELNHLFWGIKFNPLKNVFNDHELFELLNKHSLTFSKEQISKVLEWIKEEEDYFEFNGETDPSPSKKMWLTALLKTEDPDVIVEYKKAEELYPYEIEHPGFSGWMESVFGHVSPLNYESVQKMSVMEIIEFYAKYEEKPLRYRSITDPTIDGLSDVVKQDIKNHISKYTLNIEGIASASIGFQYSWIIGLWQYCYENKTYIDSIEVLKLIYGIVSCESFRKDYVDDESSRNKNKWFAHRVLCLLNCGLDCHGHMFSTENLPIVKNIILGIYENGHDAETTDDRDITNKYINSYSGELYDALIEYNVVVSCVSKANVGARWDRDIKHILNDELSKKQKNALFYYALGKAYNSLYWIDKSWIEKVLPIEDNDNWIGFMVGFHIHHNTVTQVFEYFCKTGQYDRFFANRELFDSVMHKIVVQYMCVAYYFEKINFDLSSPLLVSVIKSRNASDYENIIQFFNVNNKHISTEKIRDLWRFMYDINKALDCDVAKYFIGESYRWLGFFDNIDDEIKEWMLLSTKNLQSHAASQVIRRLNDFTTKSPIQVSELLLTLVLSESKIPIYSELEKIVEELFKLGYGETAKHIANECLRKGYLGLRDIVREFS